MTTEGASAVRFRANPLAMGIFFSMAVLFALGGLSIIAWDHGGLAGWMLLLIGLPLGLLTWFLRQSTALTISSQGIRLSGFGSMETSWSDVEKLYLVGTQAGIVTRTAMSGKLSDRFARERYWAPYNIPVYDEAARQWLEEHRYIPLRGFEHALKSGRLQAEIRRYRPEVAMSHAPAQIERSLLQRKSHWGLAGSLAVLVPALALLVLHKGQWLALYFNFLFGVCALFGALLAGYTAKTRWSRHSRFTAFLLALLTLTQVLVALAFFSGEFTVASSKKPRPGPTSPKSSSAP